MPRDGSWKDGLSRYLANPSSHADIVYFDDDLVVVQDMYPKAAVHLLVIPRQVLPIGVGDLDRSHLSLLRRMLELTTPLTSLHSVQVGFHAVPSMTQLHLHVVSTDFISPALKHKKHWHSFTTTFFKPLADVIASIDATGYFPVHCDREEEKLDDRTLPCHQCAQRFNNLPTLKSHLESAHPATVSLDDIKRVLAPSSTASLTQAPWTT